MLNRNWNTRVPRGRAGGFTLIELLVVIAIIAMIAAILFPVFATVREKARQTSCASNEKQIAMGLIQYIQDNDELLPVGRASCNSGGNAHSGIGWGGEVYPYVKSTGAFTCPDDQTKLTTAGDSIISYAMNANIGPKTSEGSPLSCVYKGLTLPANTVLLCEVEGDQVNLMSSDPETSGYASPATNGAWGADDNGPVTGTGACTYGPYNYNYKAVQMTGWLGNGGGQRFGDSGGYTWGLMNLGTQNGIHTSGSNYAFCDGHVKWLLGSSVSSGSNASSPTAAQVAGGPSVSNPHAAGTEDSTGTYAATFSGI